MEYPKKTLETIKTTRSVRKRSPCTDISLKGKEGLTFDFLIYSNLANYLV